MNCSSKNKNNVLGSVDVLDEFPFPYAPEKFTPKEKKILTQFFTNYDKPIYAIFNLPQEIVGAMFSRYSRTSKSVRRLFLDEFWGSRSIKDIDHAFNLENAEARTKNFYKRVFAEFGDDSVIQMGSVHIAFEYVSQLAIKVIEDQRIGAAYIEKSTRYVDFGNKENGHFLFTEPPEIMESKFSKEYLAWNKFAFASYIKALPIARKYFRKKCPLREQVFTNAQGEEIAYKNIKEPKEKEVAKKAYERALRARSFDSVRIFLPITIVSNMGAHLSGQSAENMINKMLSSQLAEVRLAGKMAYEELVKISPNFLQHIYHKYGEVQREYKTHLHKNQSFLADKVSLKTKALGTGSWVKLVDIDVDVLKKLVSQIIYIYSKKGLSKRDVFEHIKKLTKKELIDILKKAVDRDGPGLNRRHKLPRAFEHVFAEIEFYQDYGVYKDLQRNRMSTTERGFYLAGKVKIPDEYKDTGMEKVLEMYKELSKRTNNLHKKLLNSGDEKLVNAAEYIMLHGSMVRFNIKANLRQWVFFAELRASEGGHPSYRLAMQLAAKEIIKVYPFMKPLFAHVNWTKNVGLGRLRAEIKTQEKLSIVNNKEW